MHSLLWYRIICLFKNEELIFTSENLFRVGNVVESLPESIHLVCIEPVYDKPSAAHDLGYFNEFLSREDFDNEEC